MREKSGPYRSGEMARLTGVSTDTLRHYERKGLIRRPHRAPNGYREYDLETLDRVRMIRAGLSIGFSLDELSGILKVRDSGGLPCRSVRDLAQTRLKEIEERVQQMAAVRDHLREIVRNWGQRLEQTPPDHKAALLESLARNPGEVTYSRDIVAGSRKKHRPES